MAPLRQRADYLTRAYDDLVRDPAQMDARLAALVPLQGHDRVAEWRELRAREVDQPPRFILPDLGVVGVAQRPPTSADDLRKVRGIDERHVRGAQGEELLEVVQDGLGRDVELPRRPSNRALMEKLRPAVTLVSAWLTQHAQDIEIDPALLGTRADIEAVLRGDEDARLAEGWRAQHVGEPIKALVEGRATLAFDDGRLLLEDRPGR